MASGGAEEVVREAITGRRDEVFLVSKVLPSNASRTGTVRACEASLKRLGTDRIDLYLLHWRGGVPLAETVQAFEATEGGGQDPALGRQQFRRRRHGGTDRAGGSAVQTNQVLYNLSSRGIEFDLIPQAQARGLPVMAYSPVGQGDLAADAASPRWRDGTTQRRRRWRLPGCCASRASSPFPRRCGPTMSAKTARRWRSC